MYVKFRCPACFTQSEATSFLELSSLWKNIYDKNPNFKDGEDFYLTAETFCECGKRAVYDGQLFRYMFGIIFQQLVLNKEV